MRDELRCGRVMEKSTFVQQGNEPKDRRSKKKRKISLQKEEMSPVEEAPPPSVSGDELKYLRYSISDRYSTPRQLFLKMDKSNECSLIVGNVPSYLPRGFVEAILSQFVRVPISEVVEQRSNALDGSVEHGQLTLSVRFEDPKGVDVALSTCQDAGPFKVCDFVDAKMPSVLHSSVDLYRKLFPSAEEIQKSAMDFIQMQDEEVQEAKRAAKRKLTEPDEEGWITVTKAAKRVGKAIKLKKDEVPFMGGLRKKKKHVDIAFYSFDKRTRGLKTE